MSETARPRRQKFLFLRGGDRALGQRGKSSRNAVVFCGKRHDNKILKVQILLSRNIVVIAQAPRICESQDSF